jgi:hypothetical protein
MRISSAEISSYVYCPIFFREGRKMEKVERKIEDSLRRTVQYLYSHHMAHGEICNFNALIKRWNQIWWGKRRPDDEEATKLSNEAYMAIDKYYNHYLDRDYDGAYTNWPYAVEIGPHIVTGVWPVVLTKDNKAELYYPLAQIVGGDYKTMQLVRNIEVKIDIISMMIATGEAPGTVSHSWYNKTQEDLIFFDAFYPKSEWLEKSTETLITLLSAIRDNYTWGNSHNCKRCPLRNKCTG